MGIQYGSDIVKALAWMHLILMNIGTSAAMGLMMIAGYLGGAAMLPVNVGGKGFNAGQAHEILASFVEPISADYLGSCGRSCYRRNCVPVGV